MLRQTLSHNMLKSSLSPQVPPAIPWAENSSKGDLPVRPLEEVRDQFSGDCHWGKSAAAYRWDVANTLKNKNNLQCFALADTIESISLFVCLLVLSHTVCSFETDFFF